MKERRVLLDENSLSKTLALDTATLLASEQGGTVMRLWSRLGKLEDSLPHHAPAPVVTEGIGIWEARRENGKVSFVRSDRVGEFESSRWADVERIPPKGSKKRVVLVGESVAGGWLYQHQFTPAGVLEAILKITGIPEGVEVVDLTKGGANASDLLQLIQLMGVLEPDAAVIFAGNNMAGWPQALGSDRHLSAAAIDNAGMPGLQNFVRARLRSAMEAGLAVVVQAGEKIPTVWVLPEFNLADWSHRHVEGCPWLFGDATERWWRCLLAAEAALDAPHLAEAEAFASQMVELDGGTNPHGFEILGLCKQRRGLIDEARPLLEQARDARMWNVFASRAEAPPRVTAVFQDCVRQVFRGTRITLVDLSHIFQSYTGKLPGREFFLDYCHLTATGIRVAMAATAECIAPLLGGLDVTSLQALAEVENAPPPEVEGTAHLLAAYHNAHFGQSREIVRYHAMKALEASPQLATIMLGIIDQSRTAPRWLPTSEAAAEVMKLPGFELYASGRRLSDGDIVDRKLCDALADVLTASGIPAQKRLDGLRHREFAIRKDRPAHLLPNTDLNLSASGKRMWRDFKYYRALSPKSHFSFVCEAPCPLMLQITARRRCADSSTPCRVLLNGEHVNEFCVTSSWQTEHLTIPAAQVLAGVNDLDIEWPLELGSGEAGIKRAAAEFERGRDSLFPTFGEIHTLKVSVQRAP
jgi:hypothetical protein